MRLRREVFLRKRFISEPLTADAMSFEPATIGHGEPALPSGFAWRDERLAVAHLLRTWRSTKEDRGETYLKRHWFEFELPDGRRATVYFDRQARRGSARWWLYALGTGSEDARDSE
ncbi:MAG: DUF6504 family protein [Candidatus Eremiobacteraeota bacterium]|nr:DUF6504 family protein [Candidatus Eremiobacteraeota bacterium]